jgi:hypothetical protein
VAVVLKTFVEILNCSKKLHCIVGHIVFTLKRTIKGKANKQKEQNKTEREKNCKTKTKPTIKRRQQQNSNDITIIGLFPSCLNKPISIPKGSYKLSK